MVIKGFLTLRVTSKGGRSGMEWPDTEPKNRVQHQWAQVQKSGIQMRTTYSDMSQDHVQITRPSKFGVR